MPELIIEIAILIISYLYGTIPYPKCIPIIFAELMMMNFHHPIIDILSVEKGDPFFFFLFIFAFCCRIRSAFRCYQNPQKKQWSNYFFHPVIFFLMVDESSGK